MDIAPINARVDGALKSNRRAETIVISMAIAIFATGAATLLLAYWARNPYISSGSIISSGFLYWPIHEILKLRKDNLILQVLPVILAQLPPPDAAKEIKKLADYLRGRR